MRGLLFATCLALGCGQDDEPERARALYAQAADFRTWDRAPNYPSRRPSFTAHASEVDIYVNDVVRQALAGPSPLQAWPDGSIVAKEGFSGGDRALVALMEKRGGRWFWAEYDADGDPIYSGEPAICVDCHQRRKSYSDWVYAFELPR